MRGRYVMRNGELVPWTPPPAAAARSDLPAPMVHSDIEPYCSMRTGEMIAGRRQHREHLHQHGLIEVGNERAGFTQPRPIAGSAPGEIAQEIKLQLQREPGSRRAEAVGVLHGAGYDGPAVERILGAA